MTFSQNNNGQHLLDFAAYDYTEVEPFNAHCKVQLMHNGDVYITELKKRIRNKALFREDNCSFSLGQDNKYYFVFSMPAVLVDELPEQLVRQSKAIAQKVLRNILKRKGVKK